MASMVSLASSMNVMSWKGQTLKQITSNYTRNSNGTTMTTGIFSAMPLKIYRNTINTTNYPYNQKSNSAMTINKTMEQPGALIATTVANCSTNDLVSYGEFYDDNRDCSATTAPMCNAPVVNALKRLRSSGNIRNPNYNVNYYESLINRDKTISQNSFNYLKSGKTTAQAGSPTTLLANNYYVQNASGQFNVRDNVVIYKPSNWKYASQGGVSSSTRLERIKYENLQKVAQKNVNRFGIRTKIEGVV